MQGRTVLKYQQYTPAGSTNNQLKAAYNNIQHF